ncbi:hypothetical protein G5V59_13960 [Nocardioides sp. W3-2-3]|nr:hypothetical protein [Nocardioides convexus]
MITRGLVGGVLVFLGGLVTATLPQSTPVLRIAVLGSIRGHETRPDGRAGAGAGGPRAAGECVAAAVPHGRGR